MLHSIITTDTLKFLSTLKANNNRDWFAAHKEQFKTEEAKVKLFWNAVLEKVAMHDAIERLKVYRIYRDVRFSKDKTPYKYNFSASLIRAGLDKRGGYFMKIQPGESLIAAGFWGPEKDDLYRIRKEWEQDTSELKDIIEKTAFIKIWGKLVGEELKTAPKGFDKDHANIEFIRKKQYIFVKKFTDAEVTSKEFATSINESFMAIRPFFDLMSSILTTNLDGESLVG